jgi:hypothetical protein
MQTAPVTCINQKTVVLVVFRSALQYGMDRYGIRCKESHADASILGSKNAPACARAASTTHIRMLQANPQQCQHTPVDSHNNALTSFRHCVKVALKV